ncbi:MAG: DUF4382 domain-containing protein [Candidatus Hydrogenedentes bacterium]|nr:DUF4382 domain-containing protein [Candidatus Hydrogenedentota bacterium]
MKRKFTTALLLTLSITILLSLSGCPPPPQERAMFLVSADLDPAAKVAPGEVDTEDIASLMVTLTEISLDHVNGPPAAVDEGEGEIAEEGEADEDAENKIIVFSGSMDLELRDLVGVSELISNADIPAGRYTKIRLSIEDPHMTLVSDPDTVITDIQTTANGRLYVSSHFEVPEGQDSLILLDFQGLHLVQTGNGGYVWTPQLRAEISVEPADVQVQGQVESLDTEADTLSLLPDSGSEAVQGAYAGAAIYLPEDTDIPTGTEARLSAGTRVIVEGDLSVSGDITATTIWVLPAS